MPLYGRLIVIKRNGTDGAQFPLQNTSCVIGRSEVCDIRVQLPTVSGEHCRLDVNQQSEVFLTNLSSVNPTILKQSEVKNIVKLEHKDFFTVSERSFRFEYPPMSTYRIDSPSNLAKPLSPLKTPFKLKKIASPASNKKQTASAVTSSVKKQAAKSASPSGQGTKTPRRSSSSTLIQSSLISTPAYSKNVLLSSLNATPNMSARKQQKSTPNMSIKKSPSSTPKLSAKEKQESTPNVEERRESTSNTSSKKKKLSTPKMSAKKRQSSLTDISVKRRVSSATEMPVNKRPNSSPDNAQSPKKKRRSSPEVSAKRQSLAGKNSLPLKSVLMSEEMSRNDQSNSVLKSLNINQEPVEKSKTTKRARSLLVQHQSKSDAVTKRRSLSLSSRPVNKTQTLDQDTVTAKKNQPTKRAKSLLIPQEANMTGMNKRRSLSVVSRPSIVKPVSRNVVKTPKSIIVNVKTPKSAKNNVKTPKSTKDSSPKNLQIEFSPKNLFTPKVSMPIGSVKKAVKFSATPESVRKPASSSVTSRGTKTTPVSSRKKRPLWSEIAKSGIVRKGLGVAKTFTTIKSTKQVSKPSRVKTQTPKTIRNKVENPTIGKVSTTGHINSPLPLVIHKKITRTPKPLPRKGRKIATTSLKDVNAQDIDLSGLESLFESPKVKVTSSSTAIRKLSTSRDVSASPSFRSPKNKRARSATPKSASKNASQVNSVSKEFLPTDQASIVKVPESPSIDTPLKAPKSSTKKISQPRTPKTGNFLQSSVLSSPSVAVLDSLSNSPKDTRRVSKSLNTTPKSASKQYLDNSALSEASPTPTTQNLQRNSSIKEVPNVTKQRRSATPRRPVSCEPVDSAKNPYKMPLVNSNVNQSPAVVTPAQHTAADLNKMLAQRAIYGKIATPKLPFNDTSDRLASKENIKKTPKSIGSKLARKPASSLKKKRLAGPPLWSEVAKSGIAKKGLAKKIIANELKPVKRVLKTTDNLSLPSNQEDDTHYDAPTTGHANSPLPVVIHKKQHKTPKPLPRKGRKGARQISSKVQSDNVNYDGLEDMFKTPKRVSNIYKSLPPTPQGPGIMHVSPLSSTKQSRTSNIVTAFLSGQVDSGSCVKRLSSAKSSPKLSQAQYLLKSSPNLNNSVTPKPGNKSFRKTRTPSVNQENLSSNLQLARKILEKTAVNSPDFVGIKEMFAKSSNRQSPVLFGVREMLKTPKARSSPNLKNLKDLFSQHSGLSSPNVEGLSELFKSPLLAKSVGSRSASPKVTKRNRRVPNKYLEFSSPMIDKILTPKRKSLNKTPGLKSSEPEAQSKEHLNNTPSIKRKQQSVEGNSSKKLKLSNKLLSNENLSESVQEVAKSTISPKNIASAGRIRSKSGCATPNVKSPKNTPRRTRGRPRVSSTLKPNPSPFKKETKTSMLTPKVTVAAVSSKTIRRGRPGKKIVVVSPQKIVEITKKLKPSPFNNKTKNKSLSPKVTVAISPKTTRRGRVGKKTVVVSPQKITEISSTLKPSPLNNKKNSMPSSKVTVVAVSPKTTRRGVAGKKTVVVSPQKTAEILLTQKPKPSHLNNKTKNSMLSPKSNVIAVSPKTTRRGRVGKKTIVVSPQKITEISSTLKPSPLNNKKNSMPSPKVTAPTVSPKITRRGRAGKKTVVVSPQKIAEVSPTSKPKPSLFNNKTKNDFLSPKVTVKTASPIATRRGRAGKKTAVLSPKVSVGTVSPKIAQRGLAGKKNVVVTPQKIAEVSLTTKSKPSHINKETKNNILSPKVTVASVTPKNTRRGRASKKTLVPSPQKVSETSSPTLKPARRGRKAVKSADTNPQGMSAITEKTKSSGNMSKRTAQVDSLITVTAQTESLTPVSVLSPKPLRRRGPAAKSPKLLPATKTMKLPVTSRKAPRVRPLETSPVTSPKTVRCGRTTKLDSVLEPVSELKTKQSAKSTTSSLNTSDSLATHLSPASPKITRRGRVATKKQVSILAGDSSQKRKQEQTPKQKKTSKNLKTPSPRRTRSNRK